MVCAKNWIDIEKNLEKKNIFIRFFQNSYFLTFFFVFFPFLLQNIIHRKYFRRSIIDRNNIIIILIVIIISKIDLVNLANTIKELFSPSVIISTMR